MAVTALDWAKAEALAQAVKAMIGSRPRVINYDDQYLEVRLDERQKEQMIEYLDQRVTGFWKPQTGPAPTVQIAWGDVLIPWSIRYVAPVILLAFAGGFLSCKGVRG